MLRLYESRCKSIIVCGAAQDGATLELSYGGKNTYCNSIIPNGQDHLIYHMNGNVVLILGVVCEHVGLMDPVFSHYLSGYDYGLRKQRQQLKIYSTCEYVGFFDLSVLSKGIQFNNFGTLLGILYLEPLVGSFLNYIQ